ncbi:hypothetical protein [Xanthomonas hortorum]|uniref:hypothetical protein n=1 Tax=Xanthomonas hortorum TaxID=56454 RepID=UPI0032E8F9D8
MHNLDWSQFTFLDHLIGLAMLVGYVALVFFLPLALITAPFWISSVRKAGR